MKIPSDRTTVLGLDLGPASIGWALITEPDWDSGEAGEVIATGVRVFPAGVDQLGTSREKSKSQDRRDARAMRRQIRRRRLRQERLTHAFQSAGLLPADPEALDELLTTEPYALRRAALDQELTPYEIGRVFLHISGRRGFLSNRKTDSQNTERSALLTEMSMLAQQIKDVGARTLGEYLDMQRGSTAGHDNSHTERIRGLHPTRAMIEHEFDAIWEVQSAFHPTLLSDSLKYGTMGRRTYPAASAKTSEHGAGSALELIGLHGLIFWQRRLYADPSAVGICSLHPNHPRCARADRLAQRFRIINEVNNLRLIDLSTPGAPERPLTQDEREKLVTKLWVSKEQTFTQLKKLIGVSNPEEQVFNLERSAGRDKLDGNKTDKVLESSKFLGKSRWKELAEETRDMVVRILLSDRDDEETVTALVNECGLTAEEAWCVMYAPLPGGRAAYSRRALRKLLPFLEQGLPLTAKTGEVNALHAAGYQRPDEVVLDRVHLLPEPPHVTNPLVRAALYEVQKTVNAIVKEWGMPTTIRVELARDMKNTSEQRKKIQRDQLTRKKQRDTAAAWIREMDEGIKVTRDLIDRVMLWWEQGECCMYSQQPISVAQLLEGAVDVDHILPRWRSLDDSFANKVLVHRAENTAKADQTVGEWLSASDPEKFERIQQYARLHKLPNGKRQRLSLVELDNQDFVNRQLTDTQYISRTVAQYLQHLDTHVAVTRGHLTARLRREWNLDSILDDATAGETKNRNDHRHHAVDACVIALTTAQLITKYSSALHQRSVLAHPWPGFLSAVQGSVANIVVSHKPSRRTSGALHEATVFGQLADGTMVRRKPIDQITGAKHLLKVRDKGVQNAIAAHLEQHGVEPYASQPYPKGLLGTKDAPIVRMPTRSGAPGPFVKSVRWEENVGDPRALGTGFVKTGSNHHVSFFAPVKEQGKWIAFVSTSWDATQRAKAIGAPIDRTPPTPEHQFQFSLSIGESFEIDDPADPSSGNRMVCVVRKIVRSQSDPSKLHVLHYKIANDSRPASEITAENLYLSASTLGRLHPTKVAVDRLGRVRTARD